MDSQFAIVELLGHQRFGAKVQEVEFCGVKLLDCEVLTDPPYIRKVNPTALYALTPCTEERARLACRFLASPLSIPAELVRASLAAPSHSPFEDPPAHDDIPFGESEEEDETGECDPDPEEFECDQCETTLSVPISEEICLPDDWEAIPFGWSVVTNMHPDEVLTFCSPRCVREFLWKPQAVDEPKEADPAESSEPIEITGPLMLRCCDDIGHWYQIWGKEQGTDARYVISEGPASEMRHIAYAIEGRGGYYAGRCAVTVIGEQVRIWAPHLTKRQALVPLAMANALAKEIWSTAGRVGERRPLPTQEPSGLVEVNGSLAMCHVEVLGDWYSLEHQGGLRLTDAHVEGTLSEMLLLARAIQSRESFSAMRCAVRADGDRFYIWSPLGSEQKAVVPLAAADALAKEIRAFCANKATKEESCG